MVYCILFKFFKNVLSMRSFSQMIGCSQCVADAIELHQPGRLRQLLSLNVSYMDHFWARFSERSQCIPIDGSPINRPLLNSDGRNNELATVELNCGHQRQDIDIMNPVYSMDDGYVLISLPILARWHSNAMFEAESILRESQKFDYTEAQLFHIFVPMWDENTKMMRKVRMLAFYCEKNVFALSGDGVSYAEGVAIGNLFQGVQSFTSIMKPLFLSVPSYREFTCAIDDGIDLNTLFYKFDRISDKRQCGYFGTLYFVLRCFSNDDSFISLIDIIQYCIKNGISKFVGWNIFDRHCDGQSPFYLSPFDLLPDQQWNQVIFLDVLYSSCGKVRRNSKSGICYLSICRSISSQLLSLGFGRRELHPEGEPIHDANLKSTRELLQRLRASNAGHEDLRVSELQSLVDRFDAGPLTLQQIARVAVRRAVGGSHFKSRVEALADRLPRALYLYVSEASEMFHCKS